MKLFDEFGNGVGEFTPSGGGLEGIVFLVIGFCFYVIYLSIEWIIKESIKAFREE